MWPFKRKQQQLWGDANTGKKIPLTHIFTDSKGRKWFEYDNPMAMPARRAISAEVATRLQEMNMTKEVMIGLMNKMKEFANNGDIVSLFGILNDMEFRMNFIGEEQTLIELASCYFVVEGEDESSFSEVDRKMKVDFIKEDMEAFNFFVQRAFTLTIRFSQISQADILNYLIQNAQEAEKSVRFLTK
jgi:hypothetical protein